mgnify:CR=1 FL=1
MADSGFTGVNFTPDLERFKKQLDNQTKKIVSCVLNNPEIDISIVLKYMRTDLLKYFDIDVLYNFVYKDII